MDDYKINNLSEAKNEYCARLITILTPLMKEGFKSIFDEAIILCKDNNEDDKYLMTFQNFLTRIPKWNSTIVEEEVKRILDKSKCNYLNDLLTCVHILQLKVMTSIRVTQIPKKVDINIPKLNDFIHNCYILTAKKIYTNVYLYDLTVPPLQQQMNNREIENIIKESILAKIRESIPIENILRSYMDETEEVAVEEEIIEEVEDTNEKDNEENNTKDNNDQNKEEINSSNDELKIKNNDHIKSLLFNDDDEAISAETRETEIISAPKTIERLEQISQERTLQRKIEEEEEEDEDKIKIGDENIKFDIEELSLNNNVEKPIELNIETLG
jgi:hypothetical protein